MTAAASHGDLFIIRSMSEKAESMDKSGELNMRSVVFTRMPDSTFWRITG